MLRGRRASRPPRELGRRLGVLLTIAGLAAVPAGVANADLIGSSVGLVTGTVDATVNTTTALLGGPSWQYTSGTTVMGDAAASVGADKLWTLGYTGKGVGVALVDTGVVPVTGLTAGNVSNGPDLSLDSQASNLAYQDSFGHGTHMAGIIAGQDPPGGLLSGPSWHGMAPNANLLSVKVGASDGGVDVSQVIAAIDWVVEHRADSGRNIRVLNLSYGTSGVQSSQVDPLTHAVENAWRHGIVVVVAAGNSGTSNPSLDNPAYDPYVLAVGATDLQGTTNPSDDVVTSFSSRGNAARRVDVVAPGQSIVSLRDPGSYVDTNYPGAVVNSRFFKGSGTSQAAAVVSGAVALLLQERPSLTPDQVKALLRSTATPLPNADAAGSGAGEINVFKAGSAIVPTTVQTSPGSTGLGSLESARGSAHVVMNKVALTGEKTILGPWNAKAWAPASYNAQAWTGGTWSGQVWTGSCYCTATWSGNSWSGNSWSGNSWSGNSWSSDGWLSGRS
ncbi:MAG: S8 family serine peptidase [Actinomycetota bacterium]|nr:S8 family serine peptidase [Actinomycetota bacterium]